MPEMSVAFLVHGFEVAQRRLAARAPIHDVTAPINQPFVIQPQESFQNGAIERRIECKLFARPVARVAQPNHLLFDRAAAVCLPFPDAPLEFFTPERLPRDVLLG